MAAKLLLLGLAGICSCFYWVYDTSTFPQTVYTGIPVADGLLNRLVGLHLPIYNANPALSIHGITVQGSINAAWVLALVEGYRRSDQGTVSIPILILMALLRQLPTGLSISIYCAIHLFVSITARNPTKQNLIVPRAVRYILPVVLLTSYIVPAAAVFYPVSSEMEKNLQLIWPFWPAFTSAFIFAVNLIPAPTSNTEPDLTANDVGREYTRSLRCLYTVTFLAAAAPHLIWLLKLFASLPMGKSIVPSSVQGLLSSVPCLYQSPWELALGDNVQGLLAWEYLAVSAGLFVWAGSLHGKVDPLNYGVVAMVILLTGPMGAAVDFIWARDEIVTRRAEAGMSFVKGRPRGGSGMGKWNRGMKVLALD
ncbi:hypothetical protein BDV18DRAFT_128494 [Aspergillus unguis]